MLEKMSFNKKNINAIIKVCKRSKLTEKKFSFRKRTALANNEDLN